MKLLLVHLSDIHLSAKNDPVLSRLEKLVASIRNLALDLDVCVIAITGDIAFSGSEDQYLLAVDVLTLARERLAKELEGDVPVKIAMIPGNHDCDFSRPTKARDTLLDAIGKTDEAAIDESVVSVCTAIQSPFFQFRDLFDRIHDPLNDRLYWEYRFTHNGEMVVFRCCNSAWASRQRETPGTLQFPPTVVPELAERAELVVTLLHHPYNWLTPNNGRALRKRIELLSDVILTGHEHDYSQRLQLASGGEVNLYIEGSALQEAMDKDASGFNALIFDTSERHQKVFHLEWDGELYRQVPPEPQWEEYQANRLRGRDEFELTVEMIDALADPGIALTHPQKDRVTLEDIFVYPDLREIRHRPPDFGVPDVDALVRSEKVFEHTFNLNNVLITGADKAGKSCLAKWLFRQFHEQGLVPLLIDGGSHKAVADDRLYDSFYRLFPQQYREEQLDRYKQVDRTRRVLIIDDFHKLRFHKRLLKKYLDLITAFAARVVLLSNDIAQQVSELVDAGSVIEAGRNFVHYRIQPFGHLRRSDLVERWCLLDPYASGNEEAWAHKLVVIGRLMDTVLGKNFVPAYPIFIVSMLQGYENSSDIDLSASTYGYFYELLIRNALASKVSKETFDIRLAYLSFVAYRMFDQKRDQVSEQELRAIHSEYEVTYAMKLQFAQVLDELIKSQVLGSLRNSFWFKYKYIYYYFVANYLRDHITEERVHQQIGDLSANLRHEDNANILLFLVHLSKNPYIIEQVLKDARMSFADTAPADLERDVEFVSDVDESVAKTVYIERDVKKARREVLERLDENEEQEEETSNDSEQLVQDYASRIRAAYSYLQILGQIIKNFPGSLPGALKKSITVECYGLGLRTLGALLSLMAASKTELVQMIVDALRGVDPDLTDRELSKRARQTLFGLAYLASYGTVRRISQAVGSPNLFETYQAVLADTSTAAHALIHCSLQLDQHTVFPQDQILDLGIRFESNALVKVVLRNLVVNHFYLFPVPFDVKQRICEKLGIPYKRLQATDPKARLIGK